MFGGIDDITPNENPHHLSENVFPEEDGVIFPSETPEDRFDNSHSDASGSLPDSFGADMFISPVKVDNADGQKSQEASRKENYTTCDICFSNPIENVKKVSASSIWSLRELTIPYGIIAVKPFNQEILSKSHTNDISSGGKCIICKPCRNDFLKIV